MGAEYSKEDFDSSIPPRVLKDRTLKSVAEYIASPECQRVIFMVGAGISTAAGIPDFRSPETGLYASLARLELPRPEAVFDISFFRENPVPFYALAQELWPGKFKPTHTHIFMKLMADHGKLQRVFTQNIDTLELAAGIPRDKIVFAHGSFDTQSCIECKASAPRIELEQKVMRGEVARCHACNGLVKPDIVFFGESLPEEFFQKRTEIENADLVIVMGSSLSVYPFAGLPMSANEDTPRILMNMDRVGDIGCRKEDVVWLGECDDGVRELAEYLGWDKELDKIWRFHKGWGEGDDGSVDDKEPKPLDDAALEKEVERLTGEVEKSLKVAEDHKSWVEGKLEKEDSEKKKNDGGESSGPSSAAPVPTAIATSTSTAPAPTPQQQPPIETKDEEKKEATPPLPAQEVLNKSEL